MNAEQIAHELGDARLTGGRWQCRCPAHDDHQASLTLVDGDKSVLVKCHAGCDRATVIERLKEMGLWNSTERAAQRVVPMPSAPRQQKPPTEPKVPARIVAYYDYVDEHGTLLFQAVRFDPKRFAQRRKYKGEWAWGLTEGYYEQKFGRDWTCTKDETADHLPACDTVPYRLPDIIGAGRRAVFIVEGEKDADALVAMGCVGTTSPMGAGKWRDDYARWFRGRNVIVLPDNDAPGQNHAADIWASLAPAAASIRVVTLPGLPDKGDLSDWLAAGGTKEQLAELVKAAFSGPAVPPERPAKAAPAAPTRVPAAEAPARPSEPSRPAEPNRPAATVTDIGVAAAARALPVTQFADLPPEYSDDRGAQKFTLAHGGLLRYVSAWGKWMQWTGARWTTEDTLYAQDLARVVARSQAIQAAADPNLTPKGQAGVSTACASAKYIANIERLARADRTHAATVDQWDRDPWLLQTPTCAIDLRTATTRPARLDDYATKQTTVAPEATPCPRWREFLRVVTDGDDELVAYLQRLAGYALTGVIREHMLAFLYGTGRNGKGTFLNTLTAILGDYAAVAGMDTFTESRNERHSTELAMLRGSRLVTAQETEEGRRWAEAKVKALTGGDPITARFMRQDFFTFQPQFKLVVAGNHKPGLRNVDEAIRARLHLVPFTVTIPPQKRDPGLPDKLRAEHGAILHWMMEGCAAWQSGGLKPPTRVTDATKEYLEDEDVLGQWIAECCELHGDARAVRADLYRSYSRWADEAGQFALPMKPRWSNAMASRGLHDRTVSGVVMIQGVRLRAMAEPRGGKTQGDWFD